MRKIVTILGAVGSLAFLCGGCPSAQTGVELRNDASFPVEVRLFFDDDQNLPEEVLERDGVERTFTLDPGETQSFGEACENLQAIFIKDASLRVIGGIGPGASTGVFREPDDFGCGDTLRFRFTQNAIATDLDIEFTRR